MELKAMNFVENIKEYLEKGVESNGIQNIISYKSLFRSYIVKVWATLDSDEKKYQSYNAIFVKECVRFYNRCWKNRFSLVAQEKSKKIKLLQQVKMICNSYETTNKLEVRAYIHQCPENIATKNSEYLKQWLNGFHIIRRNSPQYQIGDIQFFFPTPGVI